MADNGNGYEHLPGDERDSGMSIRFTLSIGYSRRRPNTMGDRFEARIDSMGLLLVGALIAVAIIWLVVPKLIEWVTHLGQ